MKIILETFRQWVGIKISMIIETPEDRCSLTEDCNAPFETTIVGWAGSCGWVFDACWSCARKTIDVMGGWRLRDDEITESVKPHGESKRLSVED